MHIIKRGLPRNKWIEETWFINHTRVQIFPFSGRNLLVLTTWYRKYSRETSLRTNATKQVAEESDSSGSERSPKQAKRRNRGGAPPTTRRRKSGISARERNLRRLESNERERMRMHSLNDAFEVNSLFTLSLHRREILAVRSCIKFNKTFNNSTFQSKIVFRNRSNFFLQLLLLSRGNVVALNYISNKLHSIKRRDNERQAAHSSVNSG